MTNRQTMMSPVKCIFVATIVLSLAPSTVAYAQGPADVSVQVSGYGFSVQSLKAGTTAFSNRGYTWQNIPAKFQGWQYTQTGGGTKEDIVVSAKQDGVIYLATAPSQDGTDTTGWTLVPGATLSYTDAGQTTMAIYSQAYHAGAKVEVKLNNWSGGIILAPHIDAPQASERDQLLAAAKLYDTDQLASIVSTDATAITEADKAGTGLVQHTIKDASPSDEPTRIKLRATVAWLIDHGADPNLHPQGRPRTPLAVAIDEGDLALVNVLLSKGADANLADGNGETPFQHVLVYNPNSEPPGGTATLFDLFKAVTSADSKVPFDPKRVGSDGQSPLTSLVLSPFATVPMVQTLLGLGADLHTRIDSLQNGVYRMYSYQNGQDLTFQNLNRVDLVDLGLVDLAVMAKNEDLLRLLLSKGLSVNDVTICGDTPLHFAAAQRSSMIATLISLHANPNAVNFKGETPLEFALNGQMYVSQNVGGEGPLKSLVAVSDLSRKNRRGFTLLIQAIQDRNTQNALDMLSFYHPVDRFDKAQVAVAQDDASALAILLKSTPSLASERLSNGRTLLHIAGLWRSSQAASILLKYGANADARDSNGDTALSLLLDRNQPVPMSQIVITDQSGPLRVPTAAAAIDPRTQAIVNFADKLIAAGCSVSACGNQRVSPIVGAIMLDSQELVGLMLRRGASVNLFSNGASNAPLDSAKSSAMVDLLVRSGADVNNGDPLGAALDAHNVEVAKSLIAHGADLTKTRWQGYTYLIRAVQQDETDVVALLLDKGAPVDAVAQDGQTAMSMAGNYPDLIALLEAHGAKPAADLGNNGRRRLDGSLFPLFADSALVQAINRQDPDAAKAAITADPSQINKTGNQGVRPLALLFRYFGSLNDKQLQICKLLLDAGADVKSVEQDGSSVLGNAAKNNNTQTIQLILDHGAPINGRLSNGRTALFGANKDVIPYLISRGADVNAVDYSGDTPLHAAARSEDLPAIVALLKAGAKPGAINANGDQPINILIRKSFVQKDIPAALMTSANLTAPAQFGLSALQEVLISGSSDLRKQLLMAKPKLGPQDQFLVDVSQNDALGVRKDLTANPALVSSRISSGATALHIASRWNAVDAAVVLVKTGAVMEARDTNGETPLQWCAHPSSDTTGSASVLAFLLAHNADKNTQDINGNSALDTAVAAGNVSAATALLTAKADPNERNNKGETALHVVVDQGDQDTALPFVTLLIGHGADLTAACWNDQFQSSAPQTPLEYAAARSRTNVVAALIKQGVNVNAVGRGGNTPIFAAVRSQSTDIVSAFIDAGANVNAANDKGQTPLDWASGGYNGTQITNMLIAHGAKKGTGPPVNGVY